MKNPEFPSQEAARLIELLNLNILDSDPEPLFDNLVNMASEICETPRAFISFIDKDRQWFKSRKGIDLNETPRSLSFCGHTILQDEVMLIPDTRKDERFCDNPFVTNDPGVRFYAGATLRSSSGHAYGTLCVIDTNPKSLTPKQIELLKMLSKQIEALLELRRIQNTQNDYLKEIRTLSREVVEQRNRLQYMEKLEVLRMMTAGLCHEINNPLAIIMLANSTLKKRLQKVEGMDEEIIKIQKSQDGAERIGKVVNGLKLFSMWESNSRTRISSNQIIEDSIILFSEKMSTLGIHFEINKQAEAFVCVNRGEITQVLSNLIINSIEAVENLADRWIKIAVSSDNEFCRIIVTDSGHGIRDEHQDKIMQPFFTTKVVGKGTGLGLSICQGIIKDHKGHMYYDSNSGNTSFVIELPLIK